MVLQSKGQVYYHYEKGKEEEESRSEARRSTDSVHLYCPLRTVDQSVHIGRSVLIDMTFRIYRNDSMAVLHLWKALTWPLCANTLPG